MRKNWKAFLLITFLTFAAFVGSGSAQSGDADNPTALASSELKGSLGDEDKEEYYSFTAGPGKVTVTVDIKATEGVASMTLNFSTAKSADLLVMPVASHKGNKREVASFNLNRQQIIVMKLASTGSYNGSYAIRLGGAIELKSDTVAGQPPSASPPVASSPQNSTGVFSESCLPKSGTLIFSMPDGTTKEINLYGVQKVIHKP